MLDQRLLRENPELISGQLARRGITIDLTGPQLIAQQERDKDDANAGGCGAIASTCRASAAWWCGNTTATR